MAQALFLTDSRNFNPTNYTPYTVVGTNAYKGTVVLVNYFFIDEIEALCKSRGS